jgi:hypothetical protein
MKLTTFALAIATTFLTAAPARGELLHVELKTLGMD